MLAARYCAASTPVRHHVSMPAFAVMVARVAVSLLALGYIAFGLANFQPTFPIAEGIAAVAGGLALIAGLVIAQRSMYWALLTAALGTLPLAAWFAYAVPVEGSSGLEFFWASLIVPAFSGLGAFALRRSRGSSSGPSRSR